MSAQELINLHFCDICNNLDVTDELLNELSSIMTAIQLRSLRSGGTDKMNKLLQHLQRDAEDRYKVFLNAVEKIGERALADRWRHPPQPETPKVEEVNPLELIVLTDKQLRLLRDNFNEVLAQIDINPVVLLMREVLTVMTFKELMAERDEVKKASSLLQRIERSSQYMYACFVKALHASNQGHIARRYFDASVPKAAEVGTRIDVTEGSMCAICMDAERNTVFINCGHVACCEACAAALSACPICRTQSRCIKMFKS